MGGLMEMDLDMLVTLRYECTDVPSPKQDLHQYLHASAKCDTCTSDADGLLSSVMKVNRIAFVCTSKGERKSDMSMCVAAMLVF